MEVIQGDLEYGFASEQMIYFIFERLFTLKEGVFSSLRGDKYQ